ncbi:FtsX-like permease family protein [Couchioplanes caeruleus]|uniref:FtsX-like permease family protein n=1 Tax=Couchioplanes caeruleus TaxID=56438 RepID=UPI00201C8D3B|nr:FtsX-like permease family protein [Couchioplanes caeruleus]UQU66560.1 FtsX-like permease family protein [Couchioplanes caeruleus]
MVKLAAQMLRRRIGSALATLVALTVGVVILTALGAMVESGLRYRPAVQQYAAADVVVAHRELSFTTKELGDVNHVTVGLPEGGTVPAALADQLRTVPGVATVAVDTRVPVLGSGPATGHGWGAAALTPYTIVKGDPPARAGDVVLDARLAGGAGPGDRTTLIIGGMAREFRVSGVATGAGPQSVFFTDEQAATLAAKPGKADAIGVVAKPGADVDAVAAAVGRIADGAGAETYAGSGLGAAEGGSESPQGLLITIGASLGGYVAMLVGFVVAGTIGLSVRHRRRDLALLRAVAATPGQARRMVVAEAVLLGLVGAAIGVPGGYLATEWVHGQFVDRGFLPAGFPMSMGPLAAVTAVVTTLLVAMLSALAAARRVTKIRATEALGEAAVEPAQSGKVRLVSGVLTLTGAGTASSLTVGAGGQTALAGAIGMLYLFVLAVALLAPWINRAGAQLLTPLLRGVWGTSGYLATKNLKANAQGMTTVLTALVLSVGFGGSVWFLQDNLQRQTVEQAREGTLAQHALVSPAGLPAGAAAAARAIPGVQGATGVRHTSVIVKALGDAEPVSAQAVDAGGAGTLDLHVTSGSMAGLGTDGVAVSELQAGSAGWKVGERASFWLGDGTPVELRVAAIYRRGLGFGDVTLPREVVAGHTAKDLDDQVLIRTATGADVDEALASLAARYPGSTVVASADQNKQLARDMAVSAWLNKLLIGVMVGYAALAAANTMVMAALARRRELSLLRLAGVTKRQVKRMVHAEQAGLLGVALVIGGGIAATTLIAVVNALTGDPVPYVPALGWVAVLGGTALLALVTTVLPVGRLLRVPPVESIGTKE